MCPLHPESVKNEIVDLFTYSSCGDLHVCDIAE